MSSDLILMLMKQHALAASILACFVSAACLLSTSRPVDPLSVDMHVSDRLSTPEEVHAAVAEALEHPRSVVFESVDWSPGCLGLYRSQFEHFAAEWTRRRPATPVSFHVIDFTSASDDYAPITQLPGWSETRRRVGRQPFGGWGEYAWIQNGRLVDVGSPHTTTIEYLMEIADRNFLGIANR